VPRELSDDEARALGLDEPGAPPVRKGRELSDEEAAQIGLPAPPAPPPPAPPESNYAKAALLHYGQGLTSGFGDEVGAAGQVGLDVATRMLPRALSDAVGIETRYREPLTLKSALSGYRTARDDNRDQLRALEQQHPTTAFLSNIVGGVTQPSPAGKASAAAKVEGKLLQKTLSAAGKGAKGGAVSGGIDALGDSTADLTTGDPKQLLRAGLDVTGGSLFGGAFGGGGGAAGQLLEKPIEWVGDKFKNSALRRAAGYLTGGRGSLADLKKLPAESAEETITSGGIKAFDTIGDTADRLAKLRKEAGEKLNEIILSGKEIGVTGGLKDWYEKELKKRGLEKFNTTLDSSLQDIYEKKIAEIQKRFAGPTPHTLRGPRGHAVPLDTPIETGIDQVNKWKQAAAAKAKYEGVRGSPQNDVYKDIANVFRTGEDRGFRDAIDRAQPGSRYHDELAELADRFAASKKQVGNLKAASRAADSTANTAARKAPKEGLVEAGLNIGGAVSTGAPVPVGAIKKALWDSVKERAVSTGIVGRYGASKLAPLLAAKSGAAGAKLGGAIQRAYMPEVNDAFWERFAPKPPPPEETEEERRFRELRETLQGRPD
jgi:hypothetical protein